MTPQQALDLIKQVGAAFTGNLQDHTNIQTAIKVLEELVDVHNASTVLQADPTLDADTPEPA